MKSEKEVSDELAKIEARLHGECPRLQMTALYAAQQALSWVLDGHDLIAAPYAFILPTARQAQEVIPGIPVWSGG